MPAFLNKHYTPNFRNSPFLYAAGRAEQFGFIWDCRGLVFLHTIRVFSFYVSVAFVIFIGRNVVLQKLRVHKPRKACTKYDSVYSREFCSISATAQELQLLASLKKESNLEVCLGDLPFILFCPSCNICLV